MGGPVARCPHPLWHITWAALLVACHEGPPGTPQTTVRDSAGVEIIHLPAVPDDAEAVLVDPEPALVVGGADGSEDDLFHEVVGVHSEGGRILISQPTELRVYLPTGEQLSRHGRRGDGPGEFRRVASARICGDHSLVASDLGSSSLTIFDADGEARTVPIPRPEGAGPGWLAAPQLEQCVPGAVLAQGTGAPAAGPDVQRPRREVVRIDLVDGSVASILTFDGTEVMSGLAVPFGRSGLMAATEAEFITVDTGSPEFRVHGPDGGLRGIVRLALTPRAVTSEDITRIREQYLGSAPPGAREEIEPILDRIPIPRTLPLFSELKVGGDGAVWLRGPRRFRDEEVREWLVVPRGGGTPSWVTLPAGFTLHDVSEDLLLGIWRDENGTEVLHGYRLPRL